MGARWRRLLSGEKTDSSEPEWEHLCPSGRHLRLTLPQMGLYGAWHRRPRLDEIYEPGCAFCGGVPPAFEEAAAMARRVHAAILAGELAIGGGPGAKVRSARTVAARAERDAEKSQRREERGLRAPYEVLTRTRRGDPRTVRYLGEEMSYTEYRKLRASERQGNAAT